MNSTDFIWWSEEHDRISRNQPLKKGGTFFTGTHMREPYRYPLYVYCRYRVGADISRIVWRCYTDVHPDSPEFKAFVETMNGAALLRYGVKEE